MIANLRIEKGMELPPNACCICGGNGTDDKGGQADAIYAPGVDIDWGGSLYVCIECAEVIANLIGRTTREGFDKLEAKYEHVKKNYEELLEKYEKQEELLDRVRGGVEARKAIKKAA